MLLIYGFISLSAPSAAFADVESEEGVRAGLGSQRPRCTPCGGHSQRGVY